MSFLSKSLNFSVDFNDARDSFDMAMFSLLECEQELLEKTGTQNEARLNFMCRITEMLSMATRSSELYELTLKLLFQIFYKSERGVLFLMDDTGLKIKLDPPGSVYNKISPLEEKIKLPISRTIIKKCVQEKSCILIKNAMNEHGFMTQSIMDNQIHSVLASPMFHNNKLKGVIVLESSAALAFNLDDQKILSAISSQLALSLNAFDVLQQNLKEAEIRQQLERYTTPELVKKIQSGQHDISLGGKRLKGVVLFSDLVGFTAMSELMSPEKIVERINQILARMVNNIFDNNGSVDKFGGDSIMAHWNVLSKSNEPEVEAIKTALCMQNSLFEYNISQQLEAKDYVKMGIGLHVGDMVAGNIGTDNRMDYTLIGESVNLASRLESKAGGNCIFSSEAIPKPLAMKTLMIQLQPTHFKNVSQPIPVMSIRGIQIDDGYLTSIPIKAKTKIGDREAKLTYIDEDMAVMLSDFPLKKDRTITLELWLTELPEGYPTKNTFQTLSIEKIECGTYFYYKTTMGA
jgi:adenylate cyclase